MFQTPNSRKRMICAMNGAHEQQTAEIPVRSNKRRQMSSPFISQNGCVICMETGLQLVQLGPCGHAVCRSCMTSALLHAFKLQQLPLRCPMPACKAQLQLQPAVQLLEQQVPGSSALAAKVLLAAASDLALIPHHLRCPCPYSDCQAPLEFPDDPLPDVPLDCPSCQRAVCSSCRSRWHSGLTCSQHQSYAASRRQRMPNKQQDHHQQQAPGMVVRPPAVARGGAGAWQHAAQHVTFLQQQQQHSYSSPLLHEVCGQHDPWRPPQQQQEEDEQQLSGGSDAMAWSPAKGAGAANR